jgi:hypothetical protein
LCFTGPIFNTQVGIVFWLLSACAFGAQRTAFLAEQQAIEDENAAGESAGEGADSH